MRDRVVVIPRLQRRGHIEALVGLGGHHVHAAFHAFNGVVTLKRYGGGGILHGVRPFHAFNGVVTLKLGRTPSPPCYPCGIPRLQRRGHIEA